MAQEAELCEGIASKAKAISEECQLELGKVMDDMMESMMEMQGLKAQNFTNLTGSNVPEALFVVSKCLAIAMNIPEDKMMDQKSMKQVTDWRKTTVKMYQNV